ncbi:hypothetical protein C1I60_05420 [Paenibacillus terrae]|uniref:Uncharacterized protein n=1 Tax=Paenibacillus terrae TaxID=159743 RepID=A0A4U2Q125_9BACL|nr:hypothetical protein [Paenibacillus terrae]TKH45882.1 hypothetical protein C1I60_05420 [Paenibacillus terrae]
MWIKLKKICIFLLFILFVGCSNDTNSSIEQNIVPNEKTEQGYSLGLYNSNSTIEAKRSFHIKDEIFEKSIIFANKTNQEKTFILLVFDNGKQRNFKIHDNDMRYFRFTLAKNQSETIPVKIEGIADGFHATNFIILKNPDEVVTDSSTLAKADSLSQTYNIRVNLFKNLEKIPMERPQQVNSEKLKEARIDGIFVGKQGDAYKALLQTEEDNLRFNVLYGNLSEESIDFYIVSLVDWEQVNINGNQNIYDELSKGENKKITVSIDHKKNGKVMILFMLTNPFSPLPDDNPYTASPNASFKVKLID